MRELWPPLHEIESRIRTAPDRLSLVENPASNATEDADASASLPMPAFLAKLVERGAAANREVAELREGAVVLYAPIGNSAHEKTTPAPFAFCLNQLIDKQGQVENWSGWLAAPDVDYAGPYDVILEPCDEPFDPHAGMIQTWNPLVLSFNAPMRLLADLTPARLALVREVAKQSVSGNGDAGPPKPGHVELRPVGSSSALTGTPLGGSDDPRFLYQAIYRALAKEFEPRAANDESWFGTYRKQWYAMAATVVAGIGAVLIYGTIERESGSVDISVASKGASTTVVAEADTQSAQQPIDIVVQKNPAASEIANDTNKEKAGSPVGQTPSQPKVKALPSQPGTQLADASVFKEKPESTGQVEQDAKENSPPKAMPILLASLDEAKYAIPVVRSAKTSDQSQPIQDKTLPNPTHVLRVADRKSVSVAVEVLAKLGIIAIPSNSPVPAVVFALPASLSVAELDRQLVGNTTFLPRNDWLK